MWAFFINEAHCKDVAEIGVWKGEFSARILEACPHLKSYTMIDPWATLPDWNKPYNKTKDFECIYGEAIANTAFAQEKIIIHRGRTSEVAPMIPNNSLDFVYVDGDHTLRGITQDLALIAPKVKEGGFIGGDDFTRSPWQHKPEFEPTLVFPYAVFFAEAHNFPIAALGRNQFLMHKSSSTGFEFIDTTNKYSDLSLNTLLNGLGSSVPSVSDTGPAPGGR